ncbi:MAG TPA: hypothetical protein VG228_07170 [Solirubrobacteraceae bacterium]|jgi:hypothetical protein|nr:hypothetical protein [Solirubrobacteraceae bacterium]
MVIAGIALLLPAVASAQASPQITLSAYPVSLDVAPAGSSSLVEPAIAAAPDGSDAEWFVLSGRIQNLISIAPTGQQSTVASSLASDAGTPVTYASVDADGYDWILDNDQGPGNVLYAVGASDSSSPGLNPVARFGDYGQDMTLGPDGSLYIADNDGIIRCRITSAPSASCSTITIPSPFYTGAGAFAIAGGGNAVWFTDGSSALGAYGSSGFSGPYPAAGSQQGSTDPGTIVTAANGYVYVAAGAESGSGSNSRIVALSPGDPNQVQTVATGLGNVVAMTVGPDGNVWFIDAGGNGTIDELDTSSNHVTSYPLPSGLWLPPRGWRIAAGPSVPGSDGTGEVFFTGATAANGQGNAAIGEVSGIPFPVTPGALAFKSAVSVSKQRVAVLTLTCSGQSNAGCTGKMILGLRAKLRVRAQVRGARGSSRARYRTTTQVRQLSLANIAYQVRGGQSMRSTVKLSNGAYRLLEQVVGHRWNASVTSAATLGTVSGTQLTMTGPAPPKPKPKPKPKHKKK